MAKQRKVLFMDRSSGTGYEVWFHCFTKDGTAVVEDNAGQVRVVPAESIRFQDRPLPTEFGNGAAALPSVSSLVGIPAASAQPRRPRLTDGRGR